MSDLVKILIVGVIIAGAWVAIGSPTNIQDLRTDIDNIRKQFSPQNASADTDTGGQGAQAGQDQDAGAGGVDAGSQDQSQSQQPAAPDTGGGGAGGGDADAGSGGGGAEPQQQPPSTPTPPSPPTKDVQDSQAAKDHDIGSTNGTAAPEQAAAPPQILPATPQPDHHKLPHGHKLGAPVTVTGPHAAIAKHLLEKKRHAIFLKHQAPHGTAKVLPAVIHHPHHFRRPEHGEHYRGTPGWYTAIGHHHCFKGQAGCICTDCSKCDCHGPGSFRGHHHHTRSHLAYAYNANSSGDLFSYY